MDNEKVVYDFGEIDGQLNIFDYIESETVQNSLIAVSKVFATALKYMNLAEWKAFILALTQIKWTEANKNIIRLDKRELAGKIGINPDKDHLSEHIRRSIGNLPRHSFIEFSKGEEWENGNFIERIGCYKNIIRIVFVPYYLPLFQELDKEKNYITLWADDLFQMTSERSILLYEDMRLHSDTRMTNSRIYSTKDLKEMFSIPKDGKGSYMRYSKKRDKMEFNRSEFEKKVLCPICDDLKNCKMINLNPNENGQYWEKVKKHGYVVGYRFCWDISSHPGVATAEEVAEIQRRIDKDPQLLKVAKDIVNGEKKPKKKDKFKNFTERNYDFEELERRYAKN